MCGTKNFVSVRLYSAPQSHWTIVAILGICAFGEPVQAGSFRHNQSDPLPSLAASSGRGEVRQLAARVRIIIPKTRLTIRRRPGPIRVVALNGHPDDVATAASALRLGSSER